jgi:predicted MFS family arabinose efflux permease
VAFNAFLPHLVGPGMLLEGNAKLQTSTAVALIAGPGLGGLLAQAAGPVSGLLIDAGTFMVSAACLLGLRPRPEPRPSTSDGPGMLRQIAEGIGFVMRGRLLRMILVVAALKNFAMLGITALRVVFLVRTEGVAPGTAGLVIGAGSLGGLLGATLATRAARRFGSLRTYLVADVVAAPFVVLLPLGGHGWRLMLFAAGSFVVTAGLTMAGVMTMTFRGTFVPPELLGRVTAASRIFVFGSVPLGASTAGLLASAFGVRAAMWSLAVLYTLIPLLLLTTEARTDRHFPTPDASWTPSR